MTYEIFITILLTAITVCLAILTALLGMLGLGIGILALWGYRGIRDDVTAAAEKKVSRAMDDKLKEYPSSAEALEYIKRMKTSVEFWEQMQNQMVTSPEPKSVESPSNASVQEGVVGNAPPAVAQPSEPKIATYPGEEANDASQDGNPAPDASSSDSGPNLC